MDYNCASNASSASSSPISIGWPSSRSSPTSSLSSTSSSLSTWPQDWTSSANSLTCAFPSWPARRSLRPSFGGGQTNAPSSYLSDFELFGDDDLDEETVPPLGEAPPPPRAAPMPSALPLLPLFAPEKPKRRRTSSRKNRPSKPTVMSPIAESPLQAPE